MGLRITDPEGQGSALRPESDSRPGTSDLRPLERISDLRPQTEFKSQTWGSGSLPLDVRRAQFPDVASTTWRFGLLPDGSWPRIGSGLVTSALASLGPESKLELVSAVSKLFLTTASAMDPIVVERNSDNTEGRGYTTGSAAPSYPHDHVRI
ncbi:hypothetical protein ON010_g6087 [Phytophthora cinnamomi]|nr:hypothetical protein ON010_g6087 [Phytophthora cinnamomi]